MCVTFLFQVILVLVLYRFIYVKGSKRRTCKTIIVVRCFFSPVNDAVISNVLISFIFYLPDITISFIIFYLLFLDRVISFMISNVLISLLSFLPNITASYTILYLLFLNMLFSVYNVTWINIILFCWGQ